MRIALFDFVPSNILSEVDLDDPELEVVSYTKLGDPVACLTGQRPFPKIVYVAQPPGDTRGYAVVAALRDAYPNLRLVGVRTADAHRQGFLDVGADAVVDPAGIAGDLAKARKAEAA